jgi:hypothetical protein
MNKQENQEWGNPVIEDLAVNQDLAEEVKGGRRLRGGNENDTLTGGEAIDQ